jgi:hypothetical protein
MAAPSVNFETTGAVMFFAEVNSEAQTNGHTHRLIIQPQAAC